jgi:hypothetical protein
MTEEEVPLPPNPVLRDIEKSDVGIVVVTRRYGTDMKTKMELHTLIDLQKPLIIMCQNNAKKTLLRIKPLITQVPIIKIAYFNGNRFEERLHEILNELGLE